MVKSGYNDISFCLLVELHVGPICNSIAASLCLKSCEDHSLLKSYNGGLWKNNYRSGPFTSIVRQPYTSLGFIRLSNGDLNRERETGFFMGLSTFCFSHY